MKKLLCTVILSLTGLVAHSQTNSVRGNQSKLTGRIIGEVQLPGADCGYFAFAAVIEFEIITLTGVNYPEKSIVVIITCPDFYRANFFEIGKVYQVVFSDQNQADFGWTIINRELLQKNSCSFEPFAISVEKLPFYKR